jgi:SAM-dependent methyltransferase
MNVPQRAKALLQRLYESGIREYHHKLLAAIPVEPDARLLDTGCDDGLWTSRIAAKLGIPPEQVAGVEVVDERRALALERGYDIRKADLESGWPFDDDSFDVVHANQVIEHVKRLDHFLEEATRVLRPGGLLVLCTENLASWVNIGALLMGFMPFSLTNISNRGAIGNPFALHPAGEEGRGESWQHVHVLTLPALVSLCRAHGLNSESVFGAAYWPVFGRLSAFLADRDPRHAHFIGITARAAA